jgi:hypothetical protein
MKQKASALLFTSHYSSKLDGSTLGGKRGTVLPWALQAESWKYVWITQGAWADYPPPGKEKEDLGSNSAFIMYSSNTSVPKANMFLQKGGELEIITLLTTIAYHIQWCFRFTVIFLSHFNSQMVSLCRKKEGNLLVWGAVTGWVPQ